MPHRSLFPARHTLPALLALLTLAASGAQAGSGNLLVNGDAEAGAGDPNGDVTSVPGWVVDGSFTTVTYNASFGGPDAGSPGPADRGLNYFAGGPNNALSAASQTVDLGAYQSQFGSQPFAFTLSGWFGGFSSQDDNAVLSVSFRDSAGNELEFASTTPVYAADRSSVTGLWFVSTGFSTAMNVYINPAFAVVTLTMNRTDGSYNDGYADNLSFTLDAVTNPVPEPGTGALLLAGVGAMGWVLRRRR